LAIYHRPLTPGEVSEHFAMWLQGSPSNAWNPTVLYKFDERVGEVAHSAVAAGPDLRLPSNFKLPHKRFLRMPWEGLDEGLPKSITSVFSGDVFTNITGFIPFGFFFCLWFARRGRRRPVLTAVILGSMLSLAIESLQWYLPTRDSDLTDFLTNTLGTVVGAG